MVIIRENILEKKMDEKNKNNEEEKEKIENTSTEIDQKYTNYITMNMKNKME